MSNASLVQEDWDGEEYLGFPQTQINAKCHVEAIKHALQQTGIRDEDLHKQNVLEAGCGPGAVTLLLSPLVSHIHAIDTSNSMLATLSRQTANISNISYSYHALSPSSPQEFQGALPSPTPSNPDRQEVPPVHKFDIAVVNLVLHHVDDIPPFMEGLIGLVKPGGVVVMTEFNGVEEGKLLHTQTNKAGKVILKEYPHSFDQSSLPKILKESGLQTVNVKLHGKMRTERGNEWIDCIVAWGTTPTPL